MQQGRKIMLVDDDGGIQEVCKEILRMEGHEVYGIMYCENVAQLLEAVIRFRPDLMFIDHSMPLVSGADAIRTLREEPQTKAIPVIYFSANDDIARLAEKAGATDFLQKPFDISEMFRIIERYG
jgi:two-component system alkaline phosphatase synthesis response regulator PhoP